MDNLRIELIERLCRVPDADLSAIDRFLDSLSIQTAPVNPQPLSPEINDWPHAPVHRLSETGTYFVTASTLGKAHLFRDGERLSMLQSALLKTALQFDVQLVMLSRSSDPKMTGNSSPLILTPEVMKLMQTITRLRVV